MNDERTLFERSAREMRPEFRARMRELLDLAEDRRVEPLAPRAEAPPTLLLDLGERSAPAAGGPRRPAWMLAAAAAVLAVVAGVALLQRDPDRRTLGADPTVMSTPDGSGAGDPSTDGPRCVPGGEPVAVALGATTVEVSATEDGRFCIDLGDEVTAIGPASDVGGADEAVLVESGRLDGTTGYYYLFALPESMPLNRVTDEFGHRAQTVANPAGRRLLIVEPDVDPAATSVTRSWELSIDDGPPLATITAPGPLPRDRTDPEGTLP